MTTEDPGQEVDPIEFLKRALAISPEDAAKVRERTPGTRPQKQRQEGPSADYGDGGSTS